MEISGIKMDILSNKKMHMVKYDLLINDRKLTCVCITYCDVKPINSPKDFQKKLQHWYENFTNGDPS